MVRRPISRYARVLVMTNAFEKKSFVKQQINTGGGVLITVEKYMLVISPAVWTLKLYFLYSNDKSSGTEVLWKMELCIILVCLLYGKWRRGTPYLRDADIFISIMQKESSSVWNAALGPPGGGQNKYNASYGAMSVVGRWQHCMCCAMMSDGSCKKTKKTSMYFRPTLYSTMRDLAIISMQHSFLK